jgi:hypothetical protein
VAGTKKRSSTELRSLDYRRRRSREVRRMKTNHITTVLKVHEEPLSYRLRTPLRQSP